jgi:hypothetical protein
VPTLTTPLSSSLGWGKTLFPHELSSPTFRAPHGGFPCHLQFCKRPLQLEPPLVHDGISVERKRKWLDTWDSPIDLSAQDFKVVVNGDHAYGHGYLRLSGQKKGVDHPVSFWMRATMIFERIDGKWRIVHEHTSVPFYMDGSLRPAFDLQP